jgi:hypothetical protein
VVIKTGDVTAVEGEGKKPVSMIDRVVMYTPVEPSNLSCCLLPELQKDQERLETGVQVMS